MPSTDPEPGTLAVVPSAGLASGVGMCSAVDSALLPLRRDEQVAPPDAAPQNPMIPRPDAGRVFRAIRGVPPRTGRLVA